MSLLQWVQVLNQQPAQCEHAIRCALMPKASTTTLHLPPPVLQYHCELYPVGGVEKAVGQMLVYVCTKIGRHPHA
jgi:hypothetical protein